MGEEEEEDRGRRILTWDFCLAPLPSIFLLGLALGRSEGGMFARDLGGGEGVEVKVRRWR